MSAPIRQPRASRAARFTQADVARAIKGAVSAGLHVAEVLVTRDGTIRLVLTEAGAVATSAGNALDSWRERRRAG